MAGGASDGDDDMITSINVTPLVDIVLVLLIITMVTANFIASRSIPMELPQAANSDDTQVPQSLAVSVAESGDLAIDAEPISDEAFRGAVRRYKEGLSSPNDARAVIAADGRITHARFVQVIDMLRDEGVTKFAINVRPEDLE